MRTIQATFTFEVEDDITDEQVAAIVAGAFVQIDEAEIPVGDQGDMRYIPTHNATADHFEVASV